MHSANGASYSFTELQNEFTTIIVSIFIRIIRNFLSIYHFFPPITNNSNNYNHTFNNNSNNYNHAFNNNSNNYNHYFNNNLDNYDHYVNNNLDNYNHYFNNNPGKSRLSKWVDRCSSSRSRLHNCSGYNQPLLV